MDERGTPHGDVAEALLDKDIRKVAGLVVRACFYCRRTRSSAFIWTRVYVVKSYA